MLYPKLSGQIQISRKNDHNNVDISIHWVKLGVVCPFPVFIGSLGQMGSIHSIFDVCAAPC